ncbi:hypothetical protein [Nocardioides bruguierae]|uniref:Aerotaxis receptor n=1 Tax=Nocardioides bruguierae TaxID=2945102 RepID=A0A9X2IE93_9ACTN|nr:hypothetical protein [Nocardioides bruguierae]MCM0619119.1 hypothetical protein [Nocardioides bruguierae]
MTIARTRPTPTGAETTFPPTDLFFSRTDARGHILSGNSVFAHVSKYDLADLDGAPHSIVRHPSMPRGLFRLLWSEIEAGRQVVAYTDNLASDGSHYWTLASIRPVGGGGEYLSVRAKPCHPATLELVSAVYQQVLEHEETLQAQGLAARDVAEGGHARLLEILAEAGYASYRDFQNEMLPREVSARAELSGHGRRGTDGAGRRVRTGAGHGGTVELDRAHAALVAALDGLVGNLGPFSAESTRLGDEAGYLRTLARTIRRFSLNSQILGYQVGASGAGLSAVARLINDEATRFAGLVTPVGDAIDAVRGQLTDLTFAVSSAKMQLDVIDVFVEDLTAGEPDPVRLTDLRGLVENLSRDVEASARALHELRRLSAGLGRPLEHVADSLAQISLLAFNGRVESVRLEEPDSALQLFDEVRALAKAAGSKISGGTTLARLVEDAVSEERAVQDSLRAVLAALEHVGR